MSLAASTTVIARASAVDGRRPAPINATNDASTGRGDVSPSRLVLIFVRSYNQCMLHSTGSGALTHVNVYARVGHHAGSVDIVNRRALVTPSVSIKSDTCGADRRRDPTPKHTFSSSKTKSAGEFRHIFVSPPRKNVRKVDILCLSSASPPKPRARSGVRRPLTRPRGSCPVPT